MGKEKKKIQIMEPHRLVPWMPDIPGHEQRQYGRVVRGKQLIENITQRTAAMELELGLIDQKEFDRIMSGY